MMPIQLLREPDQVMIRTEEEWLELVQAGTGQWSAAGLEVVMDLQQAGFTVSLIAGKTPVRTIRIRWNQWLAGRLSILSDHWERSYGDLEWRGIVPERAMPWYFLADDGGGAMGWGVKTGANALCCWQLDEGGAVLTADVGCGREGVILGERVLEAATVIHCAGREGESAFSVARRLCGLMCESPVLPAQPVYGGNNWYYAYGRSSQDKILEDSRFMASLSPEQGSRPFMLIDDGWQLHYGKGSNGGPWLGNERFPDMEQLADRMKQEGVRPGLWCRPLLVSQPVPDEWRLYTANDGAVVLDPSLPDVLNEVRETVARMAGWGYELIKHDFTTYDLLGLWGFQMNTQPGRAACRFGDRSRTSAEIIMELYRTIARASGESAVMGCNTIGHLAAGLFELQRSGDDTSGKSWERTRRMGINTLAFRMPQHSVFFSHDADCIGISPDIPWELNRQWLELLAGSGTPLFVSADPALVTREQQTAIRRAFATASRRLTPAEPLDWMETTCPARWLMNGQEHREFQWHPSTAGALGKQDNHWWL